MKLFPEPTLELGESIRNSWGANRGQVGGRLYLTNRRLAFEPHVVDAAFDCTHCSIPLSCITGAGLQPGVVSVAQILNGGLFTRLRIETSHYGRELFFVQNVADVQKVVAQAVQASVADRNAELVVRQGLI